MSMTPLAELEGEDVFTGEPVKGYVVERWARHATVVVFDEDSGRLDDRMIVVKDAA